MRLVWRGVLCFGVQAAPKVLRAEGRGWGRLMVTGKGEEPRGQGHTPSERWVESKMETLQQLSQAGSCLWLVRLVFFAVGPSQAAVPRAVADCGERGPRFAILALRAANLSVVLSATQAAHEGC